MDAIYSSGKEAGNIARYTDSLVDRASSLDSSLLSESQISKVEIICERPSQSLTKSNLRSQLVIVSQNCVRLNERNQELEVALQEKVEVIEDLESKIQSLNKIVEKSEAERNRAVLYNKSLAKTLQSSIDEYFSLTAELKKSWNLPDFDIQKLLKYCKFMLTAVKAKESTRNLFNSRIPSWKSFINNIKNNTLHEPFLNTIQFICDLLVYRPPQTHKLTQTGSKEVAFDISKYSPSKIEKAKNYFTEPDPVFENSQDSENLLKNVNMQSERLERLHKQISDTMQTNKFILKNPLKSEHFRSRSEILKVKKALKAEFN